MFNKLKRKLLLLTMGITSLVVIGSFGLVYMITYNSIRIEDALRADMVQEAQGDIFTSYLIDLGEQVLVLEQNLSDMDWPEESHWLMHWDDEVGHFFLLDTGVSDVFLTQLLVTLVVICAVVLAVIGLISYGFMKSAMRPIMESYQQQQRFVADASHELKTPLAIIQTSVDAVALDPFNQAEFLDNIYAQAQRMNKLVTELLTLATAQERQVLPRELVSTNLSQLVQDTALSLEVIAYEKGKLLHTHIEAGIERLTNPDHLTQVLMILLDNALTHSTSPQIDLSLTLHKKKPNLSVSNGVTGLSQGEAELFFQRFYRGDDSRKHTGNYGLGLAIAHSLMKGLGAELKVRVAQGLITFEVELP